MSEYRRIIFKEYSTQAAAAAAIAVKTGLLVYAQDTGNFLFNSATRGIVTLSAGADMTPLQIPAWDPDFSVDEVAGYPIWYPVFGSDGNLYLSTVAGNRTNPLTESTPWVKQTMGNPEDGFAVLLQKIVNNFNK